LIYGHWAKQQMIKEGFEAHKLKVIYNSVNYEESKSLRASSISPNFYQTYFNNDNPTLIFIGRLTKVKKLDLLLKSVLNLRNNGHNVNLMIIGTGECKGELEKLAKVYSVNVLFYGSCYDEHQISKLIANADLCVSHGNVG
jgi:glycosyltransferase involved in cell wall biosynthesis